MKTAKEVLERARSIPKEMDCKRAQIEALDALIERVTSTWSDMPRASTRDFKKKENAIAEANGLKTEILDTAIEYVEVLRTAVAILAAMPTRKYALMLSCIYLNGMTDEAAADLLGVCDKTIRRWKEPAMEEAEVTYRKNYS